MRRLTNLRGLPLAVMILTAIVGLIVALFVTFGLGLSLALVDAETVAFPVVVATGFTAVFLVLLAATMQLGTGSPIHQLLGTVWDSATTAAITGRRPLNFIWTIAWSTWASHIVSIGRPTRALSMKWTAGRNPAIA